MQNTRMHFHFLRLYNLVSGRPAPRKKALSFADLLRAKRRYFCSSSDGGHPPVEGPLHGQALQEHMVKGIIRPLGRRRCGDGRNLPDSLSPVGKGKLLLLFHINGMNIRYLIGPKKAQGPVFRLGYTVL